MTKEERKETWKNWDEIMPAADKLARVAAVLETTVEALLSDGEWE